MLNSEGNGLIFPFGLIFKMFWLAGRYRLFVLEVEPYPTSLDMRTCEFIRISDGLEASRVCLETWSFKM
jgi:hypothetical protein